MCGRYTLSLNELEIEERFSKRLAFHFDPQFNVLPSNSMPIVIANEPFISSAKWGFQTFNHSKLLINARAESATSLPSFKNEIQHHRCIIPANSFIEWDKSALHQPYQIKVSKNSIFSFAGIYTEIIQDKLTQRFFTIITTKANIQMQWLHNRMPLILEKNQEQIWLSNDSSWEKILYHTPEQELTFIPISPKINGSKENNNRLLTPIPPPLTLF